MSVLQMSSKEMARKINHEKLSQERKPSRSISDEEEHRQKDLASRWLEEKEEALEMVERIKARRQRNRNKKSK